jgi:hypothetical protein
MSKMLQDDRIGSAFVVGGMILLYATYRALHALTGRRWRP